MKKLMFAAVAALACTASFAETEIPGENIVGYEEITLKKGWNMLAVNFENCDATEIKLQDLIPGTTTGLTANMASGSADQIQVYNPTSGDYTKYSLYYTSIPNPGLQAKNYKWVDNAQNVTDVTLKPGDAFWFKKLGDGDLKVNFNGQVSNAPVQEVAIVNGWNMIGNEFPANFNPNMLGTDFWSTCGAVANMAAASADQIQVYNPTTGNYTKYSLFYTAIPNPGLQAKNYKWVDNAQNVIDISTIVLKPGAGVWYKHLGSGFTLPIASPIASKSAE